WARGPGWRRWPREEARIRPGAGGEEPRAAAGPQVPGRERKPRAPDPLAELADELSRVPGMGEPAEQRRMPRLQPAPTPAPSAADPALKSPADQNLSEMAQRLEPPLQRPPKGADARTARGGQKATGETAPETAASPRLDPTLRRPLKADDLRAGAGTGKSEPAAPGTDDSAADPANAARGRSGDAKPAPQKSFYDSLEQE